MGARDTIELFRFHVSRTPPVVTCVLSLTLIFTFWPFYLTDRVEEAPLHWGTSYLTLMGGEGWRLITSTFIHLSVTHLMVNTIGLLIVGMELERLLGGGALVCLALSSSVIGGLGALWWRDFSTTCGASLMIYGLFGAVISLYISRGRIAGDELRWRTILASLWLIYGLITGYQSPGVDYVGHTAGLIAGLCLGLLLRWLSGGVRGDA